MTEYQEQAIGPRPRALAPLSGGLRREERAFAEHLRDLRQRTGMTSTDLAAKLSVDATRLSRYLSGQSLPEPQLLTRLHRLLADQDTEHSVEEAAQESRALLYVAARSKGPLSARAYEVAELQEKLHHQQANTARSLAALQEELKCEREHRHRAEEEIKQLRQASALDRQDRQEQIRQLEAERDSALRRVAELEDLVAQTGAILRLQQDDVRHAEEMARATAGELQRWEGDAGPYAREYENGFPWLGPGVEQTCEGAVEALAELRDTSRDGQADGLIRRIAEKASPATVKDFYIALMQAGRSRDARRLLIALAEHCDALRLRQLSVLPGMVPKERIFYLSKSPSGEDRYEDVPFAQVVLDEASTNTPIDELARLVRSFAERGEKHLLDELVIGADLRPRAERRQLMEAGLRLPRRMKRFFLR
ncbi:helix-turn-helix domain-containing protein [Streptomyces cinnamoneus]|uniref:HTH cro/C1-type domain-containing protein n=1 Tax=Streptomyces cinnamoneus TaxID=53446 RepID=A0A918TH07_STRCJ|nr:helix-turn-helix domain-containing protein [Streptomyces cinnamoneus]GHC44874.1 hypothetical protein GCM10010507_19970 [Streptomyces cinnamoneus]